MSDIEDLINHIPGLFEDRQLPNGRFYPPDVFRRCQAAMLALDHSLANVYLLELYNDFMIIQYSDQGALFFRLFYAYDDASGVLDILDGSQEVVEQRLITKDDGRQVRRWCPPHEPEPDDTVSYIVL